MGDQLGAGAEDVSRAGESEPAPNCHENRVAEAERLLRLRPQMSDRAVAEATGLASGTVAAIRSRSGAPVATARVGRDGRVRPVDGTEGRRAAVRYLWTNPDATLRAVAEAAGISIGTAQDVRKRLRRGQDPVPHRARSAARRTVQDEWMSSRAALPRALRDGPRAALALLRSDPALRGVQDGRLLLRLLDAHTAVADWRRLADSLPPHLAELVLTLAADCARGLTRVIEHLELRVSNHGGRARRPR